MKHLRYILGLFMLSTLCLPAQKISTGHGYQINRVSKRIDIPFEYENNLLVVKVVINNTFPLRFIFDTGSEHTILTRREITDLLAIKYYRKFTLYGADLSTELVAYLAGGLNMEIGSLRIQNQTILVLEEDYFNFDEFNGVDVHGIIGADIFRRFVVQINYAKKIISLTPHKHFRKPKKGFEEISAVFHRSKAYALGQLTAPNDSVVPVKLLMDSGSSLPLILYPETEPMLSIPENVIPAQLGIGLGGFLEGVIGRVQKVEVGNIAFQDIITSFQNLSPAIDSNFLYNRNGILGNQLLQNYYFLINYVENKVYLKPISKKKVPKFEFDKSGLFLVAGGKKINQFKIASVVPESPAAFAGLQHDDELKKINGVPCWVLSLGVIQKKFKKKEGKSFNIVYKRAGVRYKTSFTLKKLI